MRESDRPERLQKDASATTFGTLKSLRYSVDFSLSPETQVRLSREPCVQKIGKHFDYTSADGSYKCHPALDRDCLICPAEAGMRWKAGLSTRRSTG
jgi:hypothetical protein